MGLEAEKQETLKRHQEREMREDLGRKAGEQNTHTHKKITRRKRTQKTEKSFSHIYFTET